MTGWLTPMRCLDAHRLTLTKFIFADNKFDILFMIDEYPL